MSFVWYLFCIALFPAVFDNMSRFLCDHKPANIFFVTNTYKHSAFLVRCSQPNKGTYSENFSIEPLSVSLFVCLLLV